MMVLKEVRMSKCKRQRELKLAGREEKVWNHRETIVQSRVRHRLLHCIAFTS
jgi:hypothetical protein